MTVKYLLSSGNLFYYSEMTSNRIAYGFFVTPENVFLGGVLDMEAVRKARTFEMLNCPKETVESHPCFSDLDVNQFSEKLGSASRYFKMSVNLWVSDWDDCDGTSSKAASCGERRWYYLAAGLSNCFDSRRQFPLFLFIANHLSVFSCKNFRDTFFSGSEEYLSDCKLSGFKTRYFKEQFKAPAYYVRSLVQSYA